MKKHFFILLCLVALLTSLVAPALAMPGDHAYYVYTSNGKSLNLRESPSTKAAVIGHIPYGAEVNVVKLEDSQWANITWNGLNGYVQRRYLMDTKPSTSASTTAVDDPVLDEELKSIYSGFTAQDYDVMLRANTPGNYVNLRWGPSTKIAVQERVTDGASLHVLAQNKHWAQVYNPETGAVGFMYRSYLVPVVTEEN